MKKLFRVATPLVFGLLFCASLAAEPLTLLDAGGTTLRFIDSTAPGTSLSTVVVTGMQPTEVLAAIEEAVPADTISAALFTRFRSRMEESYAEKVLSAMRFQFGGHVERPTGG